MKKITVGISIDNKETVSLRVHGKNVLADLAFDDFKCLINSLADQIWEG